MKTCRFFFWHIIQVNGKGDLSNPRRGYGTSTARGQEDKNQSYSLQHESGCYANPLYDVDPFMTFIHFFFPHREWMSCTVLTQNSYIFCFENVFRLMMFVKHQVTNIHISPLLIKKKVHKLKPNRLGYVYTQPHSL